MAASLRTALGKAPPGRRDAAENSSSVHRSAAPTGVVLFFAVHSLLVRFSLAPAATVTRERPETEGRLEGRQARAARQAERAGTIDKDEDDMADKMRWQKNRVEG